MLYNFIRKYFYKYRHNKYLRFFYRFLSFSTLRLIFTVWFWNDFLNYKKNNKRFSISVLDFFPIIDDKTKDTIFDSHYIYHPAWAMRKIKGFLEKEDLQKHIDFSSSLHFCTSLSAFIPVDFYDYRPAVLNLSNLKSDFADLTDLKNFSDNSVKSLSCMHVVEHIGLGRYGDKIDVEGDIKAINELKRICAIEGNILFVVLVGKEKIQFNAHRIYAFETIKNLFGESFDLIEFSLVNDNHQFLENLDLNTVSNLVSKQNYGCGCFWFKKVK